MIYLLEPAQTSGFCYFKCSCSRPVAAKYAVHKGPAHNLFSKTFRQYVYTYVQAQIEKLLLSEQKKKTANKT